WEMSNCGLDYHVVAIFGLQSSGKSELLNGLFGTTFPIVDTSETQQTAQGIWMGKCTGKNILVMDVEGVDGRERDEDKTIRRRSALFSLATAEVLVINLNEPTVNFFSDATTGVFKTVFGANLQLSRNSHGPPVPKSQKTLLFFVFHDSTNQVSVKAYADDIRFAINRIWNRMAKPDGFKDSTFSDYFDCTVEILPQGKSVPRRFEEAVERLRSRFTDESHDNYIFKARGQQTIPIDGFPQYASRIWDTILDDKELDIPVQQTWLAQHRCGKVYSLVKSRFKKDVYDMAELAGAGMLVEGAGRRAEKMLADAIAAFDEGARNYHAEVYQEMREMLQKQLCKYLNAFSRTQLEILTEYTVACFKRQMDEIDAAPDYQYSHQMEDVRKDASDSFERRASGGYSDRASNMLRTVRC
ncbi:RHD3/Sey1, partial [Thamnocephalis sphaerospora]